jgi:CubicO group peptidase (beta-lactamase class C family)
MGIKAKEMKSAHLRRTAASFFLIATFVATSIAQGSGADDQLIGFWTSVTSFADSTPRELVMTRKGKMWIANLSGTASTFDAADEIRFAVAGHGSFRGRLDKRGDVIRGFWIGELGRRPGLENPYAPQPYASPVELKRAGKDRWAGTVYPLEQRITGYLKIFRDANGALLAAFRNPEANLVGGAMQYRVAREGENVLFTAGRDPAKPTGKFSAKLLTSPERLRVSWRDMGGEVDFTRSASDATAFYARPPGSPKYVYRRPDSTGDGWRTAHGKDAGLDEAALAAAVQKIIDIDPASARPWMIHSIAVAYKGKLVLDEYFYGYGRDEPHDSRSAAKMFSSLILGTLMRDGVDIGPTSKVYDVMAARGPFANPDPRKKDITLAHLMSHSAGLACDDISGTSPGDEVKVQSDLTHPDWTNVTLDLPMEYEPGRHYAYCSMNINLAGAALSQKSGEWLPALFDRQVARPLQFGRYYWNLQPTGEGYLGGGVWMRTRDFLKIGQAYLDGGVWNGYRLVSADWVKFS